MQYRVLGNTGVKISSLGFGCMRFPEFEKNGEWHIDEEKTIPMLRRAYELGINYFDTAYYYCHENSPAVLGKALKGIRDKVYLTNKFPLWAEFTKQSDYRRFLEICLKRLDTNYIDFYHFWSLNKSTFDEKIIGMDLLKEAQKAKEEGLIKHISFSFHDNPENMKYIIDKGEIFETVLCQYNLLDRSNEDAIKYASSKGLGVIAMGPVAGGKLAAPAEFAEKILGKSKETYELALRFVLGNPNITCALSGMSDIDMLEKNVKVCSDENPMSEDERDRIVIVMEELKKLSDLYCTGCGYCQPCPAKINIPKIFNIFNNHNVYGLSESAKNDYIWYKQTGSEGTMPSECTDCGLCESKCPQKLEIRKHLKRVDEVLKSL